VVGISEKEQEVFFSEQGKAHFVEVETSEPTSLDIGDSHP
jgi:hypothetical protein